MIDKVGVLLPVASVVDPQQVDEWVGSTLPDTPSLRLWLRDVPAVEATDVDAGSLLDPFVFAAWIQSRHPGIESVGIAAGTVGSRHPTVLARAAMSVSDLTESPLNLAVGAGDKSALTAAFGAHLPDRVTRTREYVTEVAAYLHASSDALDFRRVPKPTNPLLWLASGNLDLVVELAPLIDGWISWQMPLASVNQSARRIRSVNPGVRIAVAVNVLLDPRRVGIERINSSVSMIAAPTNLLPEILDAFAQAGADEVILNCPSPEEPDRQLRELQRALRGYPS